MAGVAAAHRTRGPASPPAPSSGARARVQVTRNAAGDLEWWRDGTRHRVGAPAIVRLNGDREWFVAGLRHRTDGPAIEHANGRTEWWVDGYPVHFPDDQLAAAIARHEAEAAAGRSCAGCPLAHTAE